MFLNKTTRFTSFCITFTRIVSVCVCVCGGAGTPYSSECQRVTDRTSIRHLLRHGVRVENDNGRRSLKSALKREIMEFSLKSSVLHFWDSINSLRYLIESTEIIIAKAPLLLHYVYTSRRVHIHRKM